MVDKLEPRDFKIILIGRSVFLAFPTWYLFESTFVESGKKTGPFHDWHYKLFKLFSWVRVMSLILKALFRVNNNCQMQFCMSKEYAFIQKWP